MERYRILITNKSLVELAGSELNTFELAYKLKNLGYDVHIATFKYDYPIKELFENNGIKVTNIIQEKLVAKKYDLVWAHHSPVLYKCLFEENVITKKMIYSCLSSFEPFEVPPIFVNELDLCLTNSFETREKLISEGVNSDIIKVFPNYAEKEFFDAKVNYTSKELSSICIVSNHLADELKEVILELANIGIKVDLYGIEGKVISITPTVLVNYDAIITIGKTVQYSLALNIPVYCYDIHGGPGWINKSNIEKAAYFNFSGRGFNRKLNAKEICNEIVIGYEETLIEVNDLFIYATEKFELDKNIDVILSVINELQSRDYKNLLGKYTLLKRANQCFMQEYEYNDYRKEKVLIMTNDFLEISEELDQMVSENKKNKMENKKNKIENEKNKMENKELSLQIETKSKYIKELLDHLQKNKGVIEQKEANCIYLMELKDEKVKELNIVYNSKAWRGISKIRDISNKLKKIIKNPYLIVKKINEKYFYKTKTSIKSLQINPIDFFKKPLISVVIPIYDRTDVLIESIDSILNQTFEDFELILVSDGSPIETLNIIKIYERNPKIRAFYFNSNSGNAVRGRNKAIKESLGKYLAFHDSDDVAEIDRLKISLSEMERCNADVVYGGWRAIVDGSRKISIKNGQEVLSPECDYKMLKKICVPCQSTVMVKIEALRVVGGLKTNMRYREDHELWLRLAYNGYKFKSIPKVLTNLRLNESNLELSFKDDDDKWFNLMLEEHTKNTLMKPKIGYVIPGCGISGGIAVICQHVNRLLKRGYDIILISEDDKIEIPWFPNQNVQIVSLNQTPVNLDIVVATGWSTAYTIQSINARRKYYFVQSDESRFYEKGSSEYFKALESYKFNYGYLTEAKWIKNWLKEEFGHESYYVPNGLDEAIIYQTEPLVPKTNRVRVLLEGPIDIPFKGMEEAFNAVHGIDCEVWCISSAGIPKPEWQCDKFFEKVPFDKMKSIYSSCDILIKMSRIEGVFGPPLEMMACGGVCIVSKVTGYDEYITDEYNALVVESYDIDGVKNALNRLINDKELRCKLIENGRTTANEWKWEPSIDILEKMFNE